MMVGSHTGTNSPENVEVTSNQLLKHPEDPAPSSTGAREIPKKPKTDFYITPISINTPDQFGETPLLKAIKKGQVENVKNLIDQGADVNFVNQFKESMLMVSVKKNQLEIVKLLIAAGADVNYKDHSGRSILKVAKQKKFTDIANVLESAGAKE